MLFKCSDGTFCKHPPEKKLKTHAGYTSTDGLFSIEEMECIGACSYAPAMIVNEDYHEKVTPEKMDKLIDKLSK